MKVFIVVAIFAVTASASLIASPAVIGLGTYNPYGYAAGAPLISSSVSTSYVSSPITTSIISPISHGILSPVVRTVHPISTSIVTPITSTRLVSTPVFTRINTITPITTSVHISPVAHRIAAPISTIGIQSAAPLVSSIVAPSLHSYTLGKKKV